ncbi:MAG: hypothetical protein N2258_07285 [Brevinematales bacterium]|nr:hypothetical protein [Brevinematales bacterium]
MLKRFFYSKSIILLGVFFLLLIFSFLSKPDFSNIEYVGQNSSVTNKVKTSFVTTNAPVDLYNVKFDFKYSFIGQAFLNIIPDDKFEELTINGEQIPLDKIKKSDLENWDTGFVIFLGKYLRYGVNHFELKVRNRGGDFGLTIVSVVSKVLFYISIFVFILILANLFLKKELSGRKNLFNLLFFLLIIFLSYILRLSVFHFVSGDFSIFLRPWYDHIVNNGWKSFSVQFSNYSPLYLYLLGFATFFPLDKLAAIKVLSIMFDFICGFYIFKIIFENKKDVFISTIAFGLFMIIPTVLLNGAFWGQCDIIFTTFCVISIYYLLRKQYLISFIFYGIAFSFKLQAIFIVPVFLLLFMLGKVDLKHFFIIPVVYLMSIIPAVFMGGNFLDLLLVYFKQSNYYNSLSNNAPSFYQFFQNNSGLTIFGLLFTSIILSILLFLLWKLLEKRKIDNILLLYITYLFSIIVPFFMPKMHERYFFMGDIFSFLVAFFLPSKFYFSIIIIFISFFSYGYFLFGKQLIPFHYLSLGVLILIILSLEYFFKIIREKKRNFFE